MPPSMDARLSEYGLLVARVGTVGAVKQWSWNGSNCWMGDLEWRSGEVVAFG